ncbi:MAG: Mpo1-like protein [Pseudomonadota bacterium]|uniref:Mpo1 family 2-hydroxy fatty acid dioxygenase n=1 Tax=Pseudoalteromonas TaxID=53246 RepID=UPI00026C90CD|nr:Mpo1-like protein [Pseudoalteromonas spongiae]ATC98694.1 hypothetical protein PSPO_a1640 [Pseudoalteromonas spongiae UST010723-006]MEC8328439.1 Mpo1-like protein [Pseudomonadota bacterium]
MKTIEQWFSLYGESHQNPTNIKIHKVAVPLIYFSVVALISAIPGLTGHVILGAITLAALLFYFILSIKLGFVMLIFTGLCIYVASSISIYVIEIAIAVFVVAWIFQFVGHKVEGKKPSFFDDLSFLLIGPAWVFNPIFSFDKK